MESNKDITFLLLLMGCHDWCLSSPYKLARHRTTNSWVSREENWELGKFLVNISTSCSVKGMYWMWRPRWRTLSHIKWRSISICLEYAWKIKLVVRAISLSLSHHIRVVVVWAMQCSFKRDWTRSIFVVREASAWYFDLTLLRETTFCFMDDHDMRLGLKNK